MLAMAFQELDIGDRDGPQELAYVLAMTFQELDIDDRDEPQELGIGASDGLSRAKHRC